MNNKCLSRCVAAGVTNIEDIRENWIGLYSLQHKKHTTSFRPFPKESSSIVPSILLKWYCASTANIDQPIRHRLMILGDM